MSKLLMDFSLVYPMFAMVALTFGVGLIGLRARIRGARRRDVPLKYFKTLSGEAPDYMVLPIRHFANLFETPVLFYTGCLTAIITQTNGGAIVSLAWIYVLLRCGHAYAHVGPNHVWSRLSFFISSFFVIMIMWILIVAHIS